MFGKGIGAPEIILILIVLLLLFGAKRLPDLTRSVGRSMRIFKSEVKDMRNDDEPEAREQTPRELEAQPKTDPTPEATSRERVPDAERREP